MKLKTYFIILLVLLLLLFYNVFCYSFANHRIESITKYQINNYFKNQYANCNIEYEYIKATVNDNDSINVFVKTNNKKVNNYYRFVFDNINGYKLITVNQEIPVYIK